MSKIVQKMRIALSEWYDWLVEAKYIDLINW